MNRIRHILSHQDTGPALLWAGLLSCCASAWSFHLISFLHAKDLVLILGLPVAAWWQYRAGRLGMEGFCRLAPLWLGLLFWCVSGVLTARVPSFFVESVFHWLLMLTAASLALEAFRFQGGRLWLYRAFLFSGTVVGALALLQYAGLAGRLFPVFPGYDQRAYSVFGNQNLLGGYMAFNLALLVSLLSRVRRMPLRPAFAHAGIFAVLLGALIVSGTRTAWLAALLGCFSVLVFPGGVVRLRVRLRKARHNGMLLIGMAAVLLLALGTPLVVERTARTFSESDVGGRARLWFWAGAVTMIQERPWTGVGLGQFPYWSPACQGTVLWKPGGERFYSNELHTDHAHSEPLEWLAETGIVGLLFWIWFFARTFRKRNPALPALVALGVFACFNTFSHSSPHVLAALLPAAMARPVPGCRERLPVILTVCCVLLAPLGLALSVITPSALLCAAEQAHVAGAPAETLYRRALSWPWPNYRAHESYAMALLDAEKYDEARAHLEAALKGTDTGRVYLLLTMCSVAQGDAAAAVHFARKCLLRWPANDYAWSVLLEHCPPEKAVALRQEKQRFRR